MSEKKVSKDKKVRNEPRQVQPPYFKVVSGGVTIDYTDKIQEATSVFKDAYARPKFIYRIDVGGAVSCSASQY